jgi:hypothetical protein
VHSRTAVDFFSAQSFDQTVAKPFAPSGVVFLDPGAALVCTTTIFFAPILMLTSLILSWSLLLAASQSEAITPSDDSVPAPVIEIPSAAAALQGWHPANPSEWTDRLGQQKVLHHTWGSLELWSDDQKTFDALFPALDAAWPAALELLGGDPLPKGAVIRVIASPHASTLRDYWKLLSEGAALCGVTPPPAYLLTGANEMGSAHWNLPATVLLNSTAESLKSIPTRAVHEVSVLLAGWACSWSGYGAPEFLEEGFAGMVERRALPNPAALVYHDRAALTMTIHGYGVFSGIGAAMNDASNAPGNWPRLIHNAVDKMNKELESKSKRAKLDPKQRIDALLLRSQEQFARADYAYSWAVMEFLFDEQTRGAEQPSRRAILHRVLAEMRGTEHAALDQHKRSKLFLDRVLHHSLAEGESLHLEFLEWAAESLPTR